LEEIEGIMKILDETNQKNKLRISPKSLEKLTDEAHQHDISEEALKILEVKTKH
jgi:hypothetical protein